MAILEVKNLQKKFGETTVLKGVDFSLEKGQTMAVIGASGGGKTTLLRCLNFLEIPTKGQILVNGNIIFDADDERTLTEKEIRQNRLNFGLVFQNFNLFPQYTAFQNIALAPKLLAKEQLALVDHIEFDVCAVAKDTVFVNDLGETPKVPGWIGGGGGTETCDGKWYGFSDFSASGIQEYNLERSDMYHVEFKFLLAASGRKWDDTMTEPYLQIMRWGIQNISDFYVDNITFYDADGNSIPLTISEGWAGTADGEEAPEEAPEEDATEAAPEEAPATEEAPAEEESAAEETAEETTEESAE